MAFGSDRSANFVISAKDAASNVINGIGKSMGGLKRGATAAFKAVAAGAVAAASAIAGFAIAGIKAAIEDEQSTIRLNAALKARGFQLDQLGPKIDEQIKAMARLGFTDDQVRAGLEVGSRFFKNQNNLLKANSVAANVAAATGKSLADVMMIFGKAAAGQTRGLKQLGIEVEKDAKLTDILSAANAKYAGIADELANSTAGKFAAAQITFNEQIEALGYRFLPAVSTAMDFLSKNVLPVTDQAFKVIGDTIMSFGETLTKKGGLGDSVMQVVGPIGERLNVALGETGTKLGELVGKVGELVVALWDDGEGPLAIAISAIGGIFETFITILNGVLDVINFIIDAVTTALQLLDELGGKARAQAAQPSFGGSGGLYGTPSGGGGTSGYPMGGGFTGQATVTFGRDATSSFNAYLGTQSTTTGATRTDGRP
jgi:hypothetical protein